MLSSKYEQECHGFYSILEDIGLNERGEKIEKKHDDEKKKDKKDKKKDKGDKVAHGTSRGRLQPIAASC